MIRQAGAAAARGILRQVVPAPLLAAVPSVTRVATALGRRAGGGVSRLLGQGGYTTDRGSTVGRRESKSTLSQTMSRRFADLPIGSTTFVGTSSGDSVRVVRKIFGEKIYSTDTYSPFVRRVNPGSAGSFPWLSDLAALFTEFRVHQLVIGFQSTSATAMTTAGASLGQVLFTPVYDVNAPGFADVPDQQTYIGTTSCVPRVDMLNGVECTHRFNASQVYYIKTDEEYEALDAAERRFTDPAKIVVSTDGMPSEENGSFIGNLIYLVDFELMLPRKHATSVLPTARGVSFAGHGGIESDGSSLVGLHPIRMAHPVGSLAPNWTSAEEVVVTSSMYEPFTYSVNPVEGAEYYVVNLAGGVADGTLSIGNTVEVIIEVQLTAEDDIVVSWGEWGPDIITLTDAVLATGPNTESVDIVTDEPTGDASLFYAGSTPAAVGRFSHGMYYRRFYVTLQGPAPTIHLAEPSLRWLAQAAGVQIGWTSQVTMRRLPAFTTPALPADRKAKSRPRTALGASTSRSTAAHTLVATEERRAERPRLEVRHDSPDVQHPKSIEDIEDTDVREMRREAERKERRIERPRLEVRHDSPDVFESDDEKFTVVHKDGRHTPRKSTAKP